MVRRRPLVTEDGLVSELLAGDTVQTGGSSTEVIAGSGLVGGGAIGAATRLDFAIAANPSGVIYVGDSIGNDGVSFVNATTALSSGNAALTDSVDALASGNAALSVGTAALASGNAALDLVPTLGGGGPTAVFTASSVVQAGNPVGVDDAGKVTAIAQVTDGNSRTFGSQVVFENAESGDFSTAYDSTNNKVVVAYYDDANSRYGTVVVGTVSGSSISFGTPVVFHSSAVYTTGSTYDSSNNRIAITFTDSSNSEQGSVVVGTVSGTSISFGAQAVYNTSATYASSITYDSTNNKVVVSYTDGGNSSYGTAVVGTISGTSISFGTPVVFQASGVSFPSSTYDSTNDKIVLVYRDNGNSGYGTAIVGTVSGTSISFGTAVVFNSSGDTSYAYPCFDSSNDKVVIAYSDDGNTGSAIVGTVSGTSISFGTEAEFDSNSLQYTATVFDSTNNKVIVSYRANSGYLTAIIGTVSGTSISFGSPVVVNAASTYFPSSVYDPTNDRVVISYRDDGNSRYGTSQVGSPGESTLPTLSSKNNFIGISQSTVASGSPCLVTLPGSLYTDPTAGLTTGEFYYVDPTTSGVTTTSGTPGGWEGQVPWNYIGQSDPG